VQAGGAQEGGVPHPSVLRVRFLTLLLSYYISRPAETIRPTILVIQP